MINNFWYLLPLVLSINFTALRKKKNQGRLRMTALDMRFKPYYPEECICVGGKEKFPCLSFLGTAPQSIWLQWRCREDGKSKVDGRFSGSRCSSLTPSFIFLCAAGRMFWKSLHIYFFVWRWGTHTSVHAETRGQPAAASPLLGSTPRPSGLEANAITC